MTDLHDRLHDAAGPPARFPAPAVRARVRRRRRIRTVVTGAASLALAVTIGMAVIPRDPPIDLEVGAGPTARTVDIDLADAPTRLPDGYQRCGEVTHDRDVTVQQFCDPAGHRLVIRFGPHGQLPELGGTIDQIRGRPVHLEVHEGRRLVTISDRQASDDRHYRAEAPADMATASLVDVIVSIPAFDAATTSSGE